jgi:hypothetical protein
MDDRDDAAPPHVRGPPKYSTSQIQSLIPISIVGTDLQVMPDFSYPFQIWDSTVRDTVHHHVELHVEVADHVHKRIDERHGHGLEGPATDCKQRMDKKERAPFLYKSSGIRCSVVEYWEGDKSA